MENIDIEKCIYDFSSDIVNLIVKLPGQNCNINCDYCFEVSKTGVNKSIIDDKYLEKIIGQCASSKIAITLHGGEPLMIGIKRMRLVLETLTKYHNNDKICSIRLQTNGTLFNDEWAELIFSEFSHLKIEIAVSLDGNHFQNRLRIDRKGKGTYEKVINTIDCLTRYNKKFGILSVISRKTLDQAKDYIDHFSDFDNITGV